MLRQKLSARLTELSASQQFSGVVWLQQGADTVFSGAYGYAQRTWQVPNRANTCFRLGSITKLFTATAVLQLVARGQTEFDTPICQALELEGTTISPAVQVRHLLTMTSGMADWFDEQAPDWAEQWERLRRSHPLYLLQENRDYLPLFVNQPPVNQPGAAYAYNGAGFILLGLLVEKSSGQPFTRYLEENVFSPAGMEGAGFPALDEVNTGMAEGYAPLEDTASRAKRWRTNIYQTTPRGAADGGSAARASDLVSFSAAVRAGELLTPEMTAALLTPQVPQFDHPVRGYTWMYGYGNIFMLDEGGTVVRWGHTGEEDGVSCRFYHYPAREMDVIILGNQSECAGALGWEIHDWVLAYA